MDLIAEQWADFGSMQFTVTIFFTFSFIEALTTTPRPPPKPPPELVTDMFYWMLIPTVRVVSRIASVLLLLLPAALLGVEVGPTLLHGFGPVAMQPTWLIGVELLLLIDLSSYWTHRAFHTVPWLWRFHAIHHSAKRIRWATTGRVHPVNEMINYLVAVVPFFLAGFPVSVVLELTPFITLWVIAAHTWNFTLGPLSGVLVSPRYHRWHHTHADEGGNKNFANLFALWDRVFGTYYLPEDRVAERFGLDRDDVTESYLAQLAYPFRRHPVAAVPTVPAPEPAPDAALSRVSSAPSQVR